MEEDQPGSEEEDDEKSVSVASRERHESDSSDEVRDRKGLGTFP